MAARTSSFQFQAGGPDVRAVAERLAVRHVLEGSVPRDGDRLRRTVQLIDAATGFHHWSERYDRASADVFAIQDEIATGVAERLSPGLSEGARTALRRREARARGLIARALALAPDEHPVLYNAACAYARLGDPERAFELLGRIVEAGFGHRSWFEHDTDLAPLRDDPRFGALLARMR
ncbi:MAG TPA: hypothetical protein VLF66_11715 [Thermoanaerobaculia bacterium]|nr:hypothetical protein [Thermoanaerobaculia bacterium]